MPYRDLWEQYFYLACTQQTHYHRDWPVRCCCSNQLCSWTELNVEEFRSEDEQLQTVIIKESFSYSQSSHDHMQSLCWKSPWHTEHVGSWWMSQERLERKHSLPTCQLLAQADMNHQTVQTGHTTGHGALPSPPVHSVYMNQDKTHNETYVPGTNKEKNDWI